MFRGRTVVALLIAATWGACTGEPQGGSTLETAQLRDLSRIGAVEGGAALTDVMGVAGGPDGSLYVTQWQVPAVTVFSPDGTVRGRIGRAGLGPGEFTQPGPLGFLGDTLWVQNRDGVSLFTPGGTLLGEVRFRRPMDRDGVSYSPGRYMRGGVLVGQVNYPTALATRGEIDALPILVLSEDGAILDTLAAPPVSKVEWVEIRLGDGVMYTRARGLAAPREAFSADGGALVVLDERITDSGHGALEAVWLGPDGDTVGKAIETFTPQPLRPETKNAILDQIASHQPPEIAGDANPAARLRAAAEEQIPWPRYEPSYTGVLVGADERLWLKREAVGDSARWEAWSARSGPTLEVWVPSDLDIKYADSTRLWGVRKDTLDVPYLYGYTVVTPAAER